MVFILNLFLQIFKEIIKTIPEATPNFQYVAAQRYDTLTTSCTENNLVFSDFLTVEVKIGARYSNASFNVHDKMHFKLLAELCRKDPPAVVSQFARIFLPKQLECHEMAVKIQNDIGGVNCKVYNRTSVQKSLLFSGKCRDTSCTRKFFPFYEEHVEDEVTIRKFYSPDNLYFGTTSQSVFETSYLEEVVQLITLCNAQFINIVDVYNHGKTEELGYKTLEDVFFSYIIGKQKVTFLAEILTFFFLSQTSPNVPAHCFKNVEAD